MLEFADPMHARLLDLLDGSYTERGLIRAARHAGITSGDAAALLRTLTAAGYVVDARTLELTRASEATRRRLAAETTALALRSDPAAAMHRRLQAQVVVTGWSRLAVPIACILAASGVGRVDPDQSGIARLSDATPVDFSPMTPTDLAGSRRPRLCAGSRRILT